MLCEYKNNKKLEKWNQKKKYSVIENYKYNIRKIKRLIIYSVI